jgi:Cell division protein
LEAFRNGDFALLVSDKPELFPSDMIIKFQLGHIQNYEGKPDGVEKQLKIGGFLPGSYYGGIRTDAPYIYVSNQAMNKIAPHAYISKIDINTNSADEKAIVSSIKALCSGSNISMTSRTELSDGLKDAKMTLYVLGGGIAIVLAFIGIVNFINIMFANMIARKQELSLLESIGMTRKQCCRMLQMEGLWYALISTTFILTIGNVCLFLAYRIFKGAIEYASFSYPLFPLVLLTVLMFAVCWGVPSYLLNKSVRASVTERLKEG